MQPKRDIATIPATESLLEVLTQLEKQPELVVLRANGELVGLLEKTSVMALLQRRAEAKLAGNLMADKA